MKRIIDKSGDGDFKERKGSPLKVGKYINNDSPFIVFPVEINEEHSTVPKVLQHLVEKPGTISDKDFLKEDMYSSPKFMFDPSK